MCKIAILFGVSPQLFLVAGTAQDDAVRVLGGVRQSAVQDADAGVDGLQLPSRMLVQVLEYAGHLFAPVVSVGGDRDDDLVSAFPFRAQ